jgi:hypothetical protein
LGTLFSQGISIFPREISSFFLGKIEILWENGALQLSHIAQNILDASKNFKKIPRNVLAPNELKNIFIASKKILKYLK